MKQTRLKVIMWAFGFSALIGLALFLTLFQSSPGPLSSPHAAVIRSSFIASCKKCHADEGLNHGCLACHSEIAQQMEQEAGYHAYLFKDSSRTCGACHPEHHGHDLSLISPVAWADKNRTNFNHPHVEFELTGAHDALDCDSCHLSEARDPFALPSYPNHPRRESYLGLEQTCNFCHKNIHLDERSDRCAVCHGQNSFKPAVHFNHDDYFKLEGAHATAACNECHIPNKQSHIDGGNLLLSFGQVKGKSCKNCHDASHHFGIENGCKACHLASDEAWNAGKRGVTPKVHAGWGFDLKPPHDKVKCDACHPVELDYEKRYLDPTTERYMRQNHQCNGCHEGPHAGQFESTYSQCTDCHYKDRFAPVVIGTENHTKAFPLKGAHRAVACISCHRRDPVTNVRRFSFASTSCKSCHTGPHGEQFREEMRRGDCTQCHTSSLESFKIASYAHANDPEYFKGAGHAQAVCHQCHRPNEEQMIIYRLNPEDCASCHQDKHRGQFAQTYQCNVCHRSTESWQAKGFSHQKHSKFPLEGAHKEIACDRCHPAVKQADGEFVTQYKQVGTRCEDCHGFKKAQ